MANKIKVGIIGPGNIGQDLMIKISRSPVLELACVVGIVESPGLQRARDMGVDASPDGVDYLVQHHGKDIQIVFDATSAKGHVENAKRLNPAGIFTLDLTPAGRPDDRLMLWMHCLEGGAALVESRLMLHGPVTIEAETSEVLKFGATRKVTRVLHEGVEYLLLQTVAPVDGGESCRS